MKLLYISPRSIIGQQYADVGRTETIPGDLVVSNYLVAAEKPIETASAGESAQGS
jgi:hypothetical protein